MRWSFKNQTLRLLRMHTPDSPNVGRGLLNKSRIYQLSGRCELAIPVFRQALKIFTERLPDHAVVGKAKWRLGVCLAEFEQLDEAEAMLVDGCEILASHLQPDHKEMLKAKQATAAFYAKLGNSAQAAKYR